MTEQRLIDANKLSEQMSANFEQCVYGGVASAECQIALDTISEAPTVDAVELVHGRWERRIPDHEMPWYWVHECSGCAFRGESWYRYCPNCGAKMDGDAK